MNKDRHQPVVSSSAHTATDVPIKHTWSDAWDLWLAFLATASYIQRERAWTTLQIKASQAKGVDRTSREQWPQAFQSVTPAMVLSVLEEVSG